MPEPGVRFAPVTEGGDAPYEQLRAQAAAAISAGDWPVGARLPTVRALAAELGLAANTVARAYRELEAAGLVETRGRAGTVVAPGHDRTRRLYEAAAAYAAAVRALGAGEDEALAAVRDAL